MSISNIVGTYERKCAGDAFPQLFKTFLPSVGICAADNIME